MVGVVRYFGGTKLGVGGLVQAYKTAANEALNAGEIQICELKRHFNVIVNFTDYALFMRQVKWLGIDLKSQEITDSYSIEIALTIESTDEFLSFLRLRHLQRLLQVDTMFLLRLTFKVKDTRQNLYTLRP